MRVNIQDDHIFPKSIYHDGRIVNGTLISTNAEKGSKKPSEYFKQRLSEHGKEKIEKILETHLIPASSLDYLLKEDLQNFIETRRKALIDGLRERLSIGRYSMSEFVCSYYGLIIE